MPIYDDEYEGEKQVDSDLGADAQRKDAGTVIFKGDRLPWAPGQYEVRYHHDGKHNVMSRIAPIEIFGTSSDAVSTCLSPKADETVNKPAAPTFAAVHETLLDIVTLSLDADSALVPRSARNKKVSYMASFDDTFDAQSGSEIFAAEGRSTRHSAGSSSVDEQVVPDLSSDTDTDAHAEDGRDPDDFVIMNEDQAKRIKAMCEQAFDVELSTDVIIADANVSVIAKRVLGAKSLITGYSGGSGIAAR